MSQSEKQGGAWLCNYVVKLNSAYKAMQQTIPTFNLYIISVNTYSRTGKMSLENKMYFVTLTSETN